MRVHYLQHVPFEGLAMISEWATSHGYALEGTKLYEEGHILPTPDDFEVLVIMGGPMSVNDAENYPWLVSEKLLIEQAISRNKYVLGICLGAQLISSALGAPVKPMIEKEIGWFPIAFTDGVAGHYLLSGLNMAMNVLHWHSERFEIPEKALHLASSEVCDNQGFIYKDKVLAFQFHIEMDVAATQRIVSECRHELADAPYIQTGDEIIKKSSECNLKRTLFQLLDNWIAGPN